MRRVLWVELRRSSLRITAPVLGVAGVVIGLINSYTNVATWSHISDVMLQVSHFLVPFVAGASSWEALRASRFGLGAAEKTAALPRPWIRAPQLLSAFIWIAAVWFTSFVAVVIRASTIGLFGSPEWVTLTHSLVLPLAFSVVGMSIATLITNWIAVPVSVTFALALYTLTFFGGLPNLIDWTSIFTQFVSIDGAVSNQVFFFGILLETLALAALFASLASYSFEPYRYRSVLVGIVAVSALVAGGGIAYGQKGDAERSITTASLPLLTLSDEDNQVELRLLEHYSPVADELLSAWARVAYLFSGSDLKFTRLDQQIDVDHDGAPRAFQRLYLDPASRDIAPDSIQSSLFDIMECYRGEVEPTGGFGVEGIFVVSAWLQGMASLPSTAWTSDPEVPAALDWLNSLSDPDARAWVTAHVTHITNCTWEREDFASP